MRTPKLSRGLGRGHWGRGMTGTSTRFTRLQTAIRRRTDSCSRPPIRLGRLSRDEIAVCSRVDVISESKTDVSVIYTRPTSVISNLRAEYPLDERVMFEPDLANTRSGLANAKCFPCGKTGSNEPPVDMGYDKKIGLAQATSTDTS